jgi:hypothetical protein
VPIHKQTCRRSASLPRVPLTGNSRLLDPALDVARYSAARQRADGSWPYAEDDGQHWIDNFNTGYNLCALASIGRLLGTTEFQPALGRGLAFYRERFFREDGAPRYFHDRTYPLDIHSVAQSIITLVALKDLHPTTCDSPTRSCNGRSRTCGTTVGTSITGCFGSARSGPLTCDGRKPGCSSRCQRCWINLP